LQASQKHLHENIVIIVCRRNLFL